MHWSTLGCHSMIFLMDNTLHDSDGLVIQVTTVEKCHFFTMMKVKLVFVPKGLAIMSKMLHQPM